MSDFKCDNDDCGGWVCIYHGLRREVTEYIDILKSENDELIAAVAGMRDKWAPPDEVAKLEAEIDALRQVQHDSQRLLNAVVCSPVYHKVKDAYMDLKRAIEILTGESHD